MVTTGEGSGGSEAPPQYSHAKEDSQASELSNQAGRTKKMILSDREKELLVFYAQNEPQGTAPHGTTLVAMLLNNNTVVMGSDSQITNTIYSGIRNRSKKVNKDWFDGKISYVGQGVVAGFAGDLLFTDHMLKLLKTLWDGSNTMSAYQRIKDIANTINRENRFKHDCTASVETAKLQGRDLLAEQDQHDENPEFEIAPLLPEPVVKAEYTSLVDCLIGAVKKMDDNTVDAKIAAFSDTDDPELVTIDSPVLVSGSGGPFARPELNKGYRENLPVNEAIELAFRSMYRANLGDFWSGGAMRVIVMDSMPNGNVRRRTYFSEEWQFTRYIMKGYPITVEELTQQIRTLGDAILLPEKSPEQKNKFVKKLHNEFSTSETIVYD